ncbi:hypothetical protein PR048_026915 [Dryococelus australis]|uniref:Uncharacterized protein n=1 Tax=Dryococelus australis TaxID=614101 RepID=A0ABQ9GMM2_9NEOP|nr:hypothetical protein PR048_026915 [Dryococelus australis]
MDDIESQFRTVQLATCHGWELSQTDRCRSESVGSGASYLNPCGDRAWLAEQDVVIKMGAARIHIGQQEAYFIGTVVLTTIYSVQLLDFQHSINLSYL